MSGKTVTAQMLFIGDSAVGKSCYSSRIREHGNDAAPGVLPAATIYIEYHLLSNLVPEKDGTVNFCLIDVGGTQQFTHLLPAMYRKASVIVMFYDLTRRATFEAIRTKWWPSVEAHAHNAKVRILVGNKADDTDARQVSREEAQAFAKSLQLDGCYEVSALHDNFDAVYRPIHMCALLALERLPPASLAAAANRGVDLRASSSTASGGAPPGSCCGGSQ